MKKILVVEDDQSISELIGIHLTLNDYEVDYAYNGLEGQISLNENRYDMVILDLMMPIVNGYELLPEITKKQLPVIILSAKDQLEDKIKGFHLGADDYLTKPFEAIELMMRVKALLKRCDTTTEIYQRNNLEINFTNRKVIFSNEEIDLTLKEYDLLCYLAQHEGIALSRDKLLEEVWDYAYAGHTRTVDIHIQKLRQKLDIPIETVYKYGYRLEK